MRWIALLLAFVIPQMNAAENQREEPVAVVRVSEDKADGSANGAARLYCLLKFMRWPGEPRQGPFLIGIAGSDPDEMLVREGLSRRILIGRPVHFREVSRLGEMKRCHMVYVGRSWGPRVRELLPQLEGSGVLTVAAIPGFGQMGGMVELTGAAQRAGGKGIVLNAEAARRSGFSFSAGLLGIVSIARTQGYAE